MAAPESLTGQYLVGHRQIQVPSKGRRKPKKKRWLTLSGARGQQPSGGGRPVPDRHASPALPAFPAAASRPWCSIPSTPCWQDTCTVLEKTFRPLMTRVKGLELSGQGGRYRPVADRPYATLQSRDLHRLLHDRSVTGSRACPRPRRGATNPGVSRSTSRAGAAKPVRATG